MSATATTPNVYDGVPWHVLEKENPALYAHVRPYLRIQAGLNKPGSKLTLPEDIEVPVLRWLADFRARERAAADAAKAKADLEAKQKAFQDAVNAEREAKCWPTKKADLEKAARFAAMLRLEQWASERNLEAIPENAEKVVAWCKENGGTINPDRIDAAIDALSPQLTWSTFAARLRAG